MKRRVYPLHRFHHELHNDVFISYPHVENTIDNWVEEFHRLLTKELISRSGRQIEIWRDPKMVPGVSFRDAMLRAAGASAVFLPVITEAWLTSEFCQLEFEAFRAACGDQLQLGDYSRIVPVEKLPVKERHPLMRKILAERFYGERNCRIEPFGLPHSYRGDSPFERSVQQVAGSIAQILERIEEAKLAVPRELNRMVAGARQHAEPLIRDRCSTMKILGMTQSIDARGIYTRVNFLERISGRNRQLADDMLKTASRDQFERFGIAAQRKHCVSGVEAVDRHHRLLILGKPGSGKTTFLRRMAYQCIMGAYRPDLVPAFISLREFARMAGVKTVDDVLVSHWGLDDAQVVGLLRGGCGFILLDGLDEVDSKHNDRVLDAVDTFTRRYPRTAVVLTCRIAAREYTFEQFSEVEIADFDHQQITYFAKNWFSTRHMSEKADVFVQKLRRNRPMMELASSPLLLTLLCLIFEERTDFEGDRAELYREGLEVLLRKWDATRNIERDQPYRDLTLARKQDLLCQIAYERFEKNEYFFKQSELEADIAKYFASQTGTPVKASAGAVLNAIEAQHGILVARAHRVYSFSHLTFQEYLTAKRIFDDPNPRKWSILMQNIGRRRWREVFLLLANMLSPVDFFLQSMSQELRRRVDRNRALLEYVRWVERMAARVNVGARPSFVRAVYWTCGLASRQDAPPNHQRGYERYQDTERAEALVFDLAQSVDGIAKTTLINELDATADFEMNLERKMEIRSLGRSVSRAQLSGVVSAQGPVEDRQAWVKELLTGLRSGFSMPQLALTEQDSRALEQLETGSILMLECARNSRGSKAVQQEIIDSVIKLTAAEKRVGAPFANSPNPRNHS